MLINLHTHTTFCDGDNSAEEIVIAAIKNGFSAIGFSGHAYTPWDLRYCMKNTAEYIKEINRLKEKYKNDINIYLGTEEDCFAPCQRDNYDYIIGSSHYGKINGKYYSVDCSHDSFKECLKAFDGNILKMAEAYYSNFCEYIIKRKPDIIGHFDLITKFDELDEPYFSENPEYEKLALRYTEIAASSSSVFEINTGAITRGYRKTPYPSLPLLYKLKELGARLTLSSDSHSKDTLNAYFDEAKKLLRDVGFRHIYNYNGKEFIKEEIL